MKMQHQSFHAESTTRAAVIADRWLDANTDIVPLRRAAEPARVTVIYYRRRADDET